ncbi:aarF domain-containing protein kinase 1 isoform X1, partial [Tachysurus ichikawai]
TAVISYDYLTTLREAQYGTEEYWSLKSQQSKAETKLLLCKNSFPVKSVCALARSLALDKFLRLSPFKPPVYLAPSRHEQAHQQSEYLHVRDYDHCGNHVLHGRINLPSLSHLTVHFLCTSAIVSYVLDLSDGCSPARSDYVTGNTCGFRRRRGFHAAYE